MLKNIVRVILVILLSVALFVFPPNKGDAQKTTIVELIEEEPAISEPTEVTVGKIKDYIRYKFPEEPDMALAVAMAESLAQYGTDCAVGDKNNIYAPEGSHGVMQINIGVHKNKIKGRDVCYYKDNIDIAREIYDERSHVEYGWKAWGAYLNGSYIKYLPR